MPNRRPPAPPPLTGYRPSADRPPMPAARRGPPAPPPHLQSAARGGRPPQPPRKRGGLAKLILGAAFILLLALGGGFAYLILNPPSDLIRQTITQQVKEKTGRDLVVSGPAAFSFYPGLGVTLHDVTLSGPPGSASTLVKMAELDINIKTMPLLNRQIEVRRLILRQPVFDLRVDKGGNKNWTFADASPVRYAQAESDAPAAQPEQTQDPVSDAPPPARHNLPGIRLPTKLSEVDHLQMDDVRLEDGTLRYTDERTGKTQSVTAVNMKLNIKSLSSALAAEGDFSWQGEKTEFEGKVSPVRMVLEEKPAQLDFNAKNQHIAAAYDGALNVSDGADLNGKINISGDSVKSLAHWLGTPVPNVAGLGPFSIAGDLATDGNVTSLSNATLTLDGATATGTTRVTTGGVRPYVTANLQISELDLNKYLGNAGTAAKAPAPAAASGGAAPKGGAAEGQGDGDAIGDLLNKPATGPKVHGYEARAGWSSAPIDLSLLGVADTDAKLRVAKLIFQDIKVGQSALTVALKNKVLKTTFDNVQLYEGQGKGFLNVDATAKIPSIGANFGLDGISALPFLKDAAGFDWLSGKTRVALQLATQGSSQLQFVENLNGKADFAFADGAIVGFNVPGALRGLSQGKFNGLKKTPTEKTDFSEFAASFNIANGVAQNQDFRLTSPMLRVAGAGAVQMPQRTLDYTVKPKIVASLEGQQGAANVSGIEVPVRITGSWDKPSYEPDLKALLADPNKAIDTVKQIGKQFKGKSGKEIVDGLLGKGDGTQTGSAPKAKDILNNLFKKQ